jgi:hypothetical protein
MDSVVALTSEATQKQSGARKSRAGCGTYSRPEPGVKAQHEGKLRGE